MMTKFSSLEFHPKFWNFELPCFVSKLKWMLEFSIVLLLISKCCKEPCA